MYQTQHTSADMLRLDYYLSFIASSSHPFSLDSMREREKTNKGGASYVQQKETITLDYTPYPVYFHQ